ncbi:FAS1-like dehydratase domain-containing protein [Azospirillum rugosum]|uniref:3-methylfumaryl-CoA hydratase n=1 Tax=Azospirillum rugosum TaxID=416170 RepID=A0ABS4SUW0_9PROT|nr:MaoC family dehydratase N-terminal domain-containing protein [Azospirillum rugosum]MBP2295984.1 3-methylfumaryl-CoA hydratase [Azospirillum rugosum]MDQ0529574.1 3-methylfumaryl-CoA hydratase [Azospirillum rugosum]
MSFDHLKDWIGREEEHLDVATAAPLAGLAATLDHLDPPWRAGEIPPLGHWLYFLPKAAQREIAEDGHPHRGGFLPPVPLPRRMWAGSQLEFVAPIRTGEALRRRSTIGDVQHKSGRSGEMVFVKVLHEVSTEAGLAIREVHDIVYREAPKPGEAPPPSEPSPDAVWRRPMVPDPVLLFRYSAITFNGHRIHYDRKYCEEVEGYPGLIVHGPLTATLLVDLFLRENPGARVTAYRFRARRPLFDVHPFTLCGSPRVGGATLWALDHTGQIAMSAELEAA